MNPSSGSDDSFAYRSSGFASSFANRIGSAWYGEAREPGQTRARLKGYLNNIKESYQAGYAGTFQGIDNFGEGLSEAYPDANIHRGGDQEMILFPCYSRHHLRNKDGTDNSQDLNEHEHDNDNESQMEENAGKAIQVHWDQYDEHHALVDIDVRGWIYTPHKGAMTRKQRLALGIARQLAGLPTILPTGLSAKNSRESSPHPIRERLQDHNTRIEQEQVDMATDDLLTKAEKEAEKAGRGEYSEQYGKDKYPLPRKVSGLQRVSSNESAVMAQKRATWAVISELSPEESALANENLMNRLRPFYANPISNLPVSVFFYNDKESRMRTVYTNIYGQFALRAALSFVPTHVRIMVSDTLSANQTVTIMESAGINVISDIDDTVKHTGMLNGAREAFRNAFLRNTEDLIIDGVQDWYKKLEAHQATFHYVSNSPWQLFPVLAGFMATSKLPTGSIHLKQYTGLYQGIFEPVAERKKSTLDRIARDFPERYFILIGDSGEADLEVYLDFVRDNPGRVLGIFIRDVTTPDIPGYFDFNAGPLFTPISSPPGSPQMKASDHRDPELRAAIQASLQEFEIEEKKIRPIASSPSSPPRPPRLAKDDADDLIAFSDSEPGSPDIPPLRKQPQAVSMRLGRPQPPKKPDTLRSSSAQLSLLPPPALPQRPGPRSSNSEISSSPLSKTTLVSDANYESKQRNQQRPPPPPSLPVRRTQTAGPSVAAHSTQLSSSPTLAAALASRLPSIPQLSSNPSSAHTSPPGSPTINGVPIPRVEKNRWDLWRRRWAHAQSAMKKEGVVLRAWRGNGDEGIEGGVVEESLRLIEKAKNLAAKYQDARNQPN